MKIGIIIQARMGSTRLPGKVLRKIGERSLLQILIERISGCNLPVIVATTTNQNDDVVANRLQALNVMCFRGSEDDVLGRYYECALKYELDVVVRLTADNPFVDDELIKWLVAEFFKEGIPEAYVSTTGYPLGVSGEIFSVKSLQRAFLGALDVKEREHVTPYIIHDTKVAKKYITSKKNREHYRLTIDTERDFMLAHELIMKHNAIHLKTGELIDVMDKNPYLAKINADVVQKKWND